MNSNVELTVPNNIKYRTPVYIHSHENTLSYVRTLVDRNSNSLLRNGSVNKKANELFTQAEIILKKYYEDENLKSFYDECHDGSTRKTKTAADDNILKALEYIRSKVEEFKKAEEKEYKEFFKALIGKKRANQNKTLVEMVGEEASKTVLKLLKESLKHHKIKAENSKNGKKPNAIDLLKKKLDADETILIKDLMTSRNVVLKTVLSAFRSGMHKDVAPNTSTEIIKVMDELDKLINAYIASSNELSKLSYIPSSELINTIKLRNQHGRSDLLASNMGFMFEKLYPALLQSSLSNVNIMVNGTELLDGNSIIEHEGRTDHGVTTDIVVRFSEKLSFGISNKLNYFSEEKRLGTSFVKSASITKEQHEQVFSDKKDKEDFSDLLYYLGNTKAYSVFAASSNIFRDGRKRVVTKEKGKNEYTSKLNEVETATKPMNQLDWYVRIKKEYAAIGLIKAMLGYFFLIPNSEEVEKQLASSTPPIWLAFGHEDFWTYEIITRLHEEFKNNFKNFESFIKIKNPNAIIYSSLFSSFTLESLKTLFLIKKLIPNNGGNRINQIWDGSVDSKYGALSKGYSNVRQILATVTNSLTEENLIKELINDVQYNINISKLLGGQ